MAHLGCPRAPRPFSVPRRVASVEGGGGGGLIDGVAMPCYQPRSPISGYARPGHSVASEPPDTARFRVPLKIRREFLTKLITCGLPNQFLTPVFKCL